MRKEYIRRYKKAQKSRGRDKKTGRFFTKKKKYEYDIVTYCKENTKKGTGVKIEMNFTIVSNKDEDYFYNRKHKIMSYATNKLKYDIRSDIFDVELAISGKKETRKRISKIVNFKAWVRYFHKKKGDERAVLKVLKEATGGFDVKDIE